MEEDPIICTCLDMTRSEILTAIRQQKLKTLEEVADAIEAGAVCGACHEDIQDLLDAENGED